MIIHVVTLMNPRGTLLSDLTQNVGLSIFPNGQLETSNSGKIRQGYISLFFPLTTTKTLEHYI